jgi:predicted transcriptional regulator
MTNAEPSDFKKRLQAWAERRGISPTTFANQMGYTYGHGYQLLRGDAFVTVEVLGRILLTYGAEAAAEVAGSPQSVPTSERG